MDKPAVQQTVEASDCGKYFNGFRSDVSKVSNGHRKEQRKKELLFIDCTVHLVLCMKVIRGCGVMAFTWTDIINEAYLSLRRNVH